MVCRKIILNNKVLLNKHYNCLKKKIKTLQFIMLNTVTFQVSSNTRTIESFKVIHVIYATMC